MNRSYNTLGVDNHLAAKSPFLRKGAKHTFDVDLAGAQILGLRVSDGGDGGDSDHADWCDALLYLKPQTVTRPETIDMR